MYCAKCDKEVVEQKIAQATTDQRPVNTDILTQLASKVLASLEILTQSLPEKPHKEEIRTFASTAKELIEILRGIRELQSQ
jgi:hypothetical protein